MNPCSQCGANLPEGAKFCFQCGSPVQPPETKPPVATVELEFVQPALAGGMFLGVLSSLPLIQAGNCLCCMWVLGGGGIAAFLLSKQRPGGSIRYGDGAFAGVLSGLFGAVVATAISFPVQMIMERILGSQRQAIEDAMKGVPGFEGPMRDLMMRVVSTEISLPTIAFKFFLNLLSFSLFAMIGGILTVAILEKRKGAGVTPRPDVPS